MGLSPNKYWINDFNFLQQESKILIVEIKNNFEGGIEPIFFSKRLLYFFPMILNLISLKAYSPLFLRLISFNSSIEVFCNF